MQRRTTRLLIVSIGVALIGLVAVQALWVRDILAMRDAQFNEAIDNALVAASERLERAEARQVLDHFAETGRSGGRIGELQASDSANGGGLVDQDRLDDLIRGMLSAGALRSIRERIDPRLLDSLLREELHLRHLKGDYEFGILDGGGTVVMAGPREGVDTAALRSSMHRTVLFRNDWPRARGEAPAWWLALHVPDRPSLWLRTMWPMLASSALFLLLIAVVFGFTLRTIFRQKRLGNIKDDLVNNLTHELKTPISTISLACEALMDPGMPKGEEEVRMLVGMVRDENKRLGMLVESVLLSAVADQGGMQLRFSDVDMHALLAEVVRNGSLQAAKRGGAIHLHPNAELAHVSGDRTYLTSVFYNLIDNAVKYCTGPPDIHISTRSDAQAVIISVRDNGIGIPRSEQKKIFDRLYRIPTGNVHNVKGFGLGLSYVKSVVERHHGTIRVEGNDEQGGGPGSCFIITLPFEHDQKDQGAAVRG